VIPYIITPADHNDHRYQSISYCAESFVACDVLFPSSELTPHYRAASTTPCAVHTSVLSRLNATASYLVASQNGDGSWGTLGSGDAARSPRAATLLQVGTHLALLRPSTLYQLLVMHCCSGTARHSGRSLRMRPRSSAGPISC
jgi:hypothetical protein